jgi:hypothetical protein
MARKFASERTIKQFFFIPLLFRESQKRGNAVEAAKSIDIAILAAVDNFSYIYNSAGVGDGVEVVTHPEDEGRFDAVFYV